MSCNRLPGPLRIAGANQVFGDGDVVWKPRESFKIDLMQNHIPSIGFVTGARTDATFC